MPVVGEAVNVDTTQPPLVVGTPVANDKSQAATAAAAPSTHGPVVPLDG